MNKSECISSIKREKVIAILRGCTAVQCLETAKALHEGGICFVEITFDQTGRIPFSETLQAVSLIREQMEGILQVGAGTVLDPSQAEEACRAGAMYIISPDSNERVISRTNELDMVSIPGAFSPTEITAAYAAGADFVKVFPADLLGPSYIRSLRGPLGHIPLMAVGGISHENLGAFLEAGCCGAGIGGKLADRAAIEAGRYDLITETARRIRQVL